MRGLMVAVCRTVRRQRFGWLRVGGTAVVVAVAGLVTRVTPAPTAITPRRAVLVVTAALVGVAGMGAMVRTAGTRGTGGR